MALVCGSSPGSHGMDFRTSVRSQLAARNKSMKGVEMFQVSHKRTVDRLREATGEINDLKRKVEAMQSENERLSVEIITSRASTSHAAVAGETIRAEMESKDKKIAELTAELFNLLKSQNEESKAEVGLHRRVELLEEQLQKKTSACEKLARSCGELQCSTEMLQKELQSRNSQLQTLEDEFRFTQLESKSASENLEKMTKDYNDLLERMKREKQTQVDKMNESNQSDIEATSSRVKAELLAAAEGREMDDTIGDSMFNTGGMSQLPTSLLHVNTGHSAEILACTFKEDGSQFVTGSGDQLVKVWKPSGQLVSTYKKLSSTVTCLAYSANGLQLAVGTERSTIQIFNVTTARAEHVMNNHTNRINSISFCPSSDNMYSASKDHTIKVWDTKRGSFKASALCDSTCTALQCTTATWLLSAHYDKTLNVRDPRADINKTALGIATEHNTTITHMACSPNGDVVATLARDHSMRLHDVRTLTHMRTLCADGFNVGTAGCQPCFSSDGHYLAAGSMDGRVFIWNSNTGALEKILRDGHTAAVMAMAWHPNGAGLLSVGKDHKLALWG
eukprot:m.672110 g.672110  ORF g.672110 m.672110 type:complete len:563 (+) comp22776_c1_seq27:274-1962(+)